MSRCIDREKQSCWCVVHYSRQPGQARPCFGQLLNSSVFSNSLNAVQITESTFRWFGNHVCDDWNRLPGWVVSGESVNEFMGNSDHYLRDNKGFK